MKTKRIFILVSLMLIALFLMPACAQFSKDTPTPEPAPTSAPAAAETEAPTAAPTEAPTEAPAEPEGLTVDAVTGYRDTFNDLYLVGLVTNHTDQMMDSIEVAVQILDANGNVLGSETGDLDLYTLAPGETGTFSIWATNEYPDASAYEAQIVGYSPSEYSRPDFVITNTRMVVDDDGTVYILGDLINTDTQHLTVNTVSAAVFDSNNNLLVANNYASFSSYVAPDNDYTPVMVEFNLPDGVTASDLDTYQLYADAVASDSAPDQYEIKLDGTNNYVDNWGDFHLVGEATNMESDLSLNIRLVAGIYDADDKPLDVSTMDLPLSALAPGEKTSFDFQSWGPLNHISDYIDQADHYVIFVDPTWTWETSATYLDISTKDNTFTPYNGNVTIDGTIVNDSGQSLAYMLVFAEIRDKDSGTLLATGYTSVYPDESLAPGDTAPYEMTIYLDPTLDLDSVEFTYTAKGQTP